MKSVQSSNRWTLREVSYPTIFVISLVLSMLIILLKKSELLLRSDVLSQEALSLIEYQAGNSGSLFLSILAQRIWIIPLLFLMSTTYLASVAVYGTIVWYGMSIGSLLAVAILRYGLAGVVFLLACSFPQYIFYVPAMVISLQLNNQMRTPGRKFFLQLVILECVVIIGCMVESYVNILLIDNIIKIFIGV